MNAATEINRLEEQVRTLNRLIELVLADNRHLREELRRAQLQIRRQQLQIRRQNDDIRILRGGLSLVLVWWRWWS